MVEHYEDFEAINKIMSGIQDELPTATYLVMVHIRNPTPRVHRNVSASRLCRGVLRVRPTRPTL